MHIVMQQSCLATEWRTLTW